MERRSATEIPRRLGHHPTRREDAVPPSYVYSRILGKLVQHAGEVEKIFTRLVTGKENIVYDYCGTVYCHCPETNKRREMAFGGFEKDQETLKYRCPARHHNVKCRGIEQCSATGGVRIPLAEDRQVFTLLARSSYKWKTS